MNNELQEQYKRDVMSLAENGCWGEALDRLNEQPELATAIFDFEETLLISLAAYPRASVLLLRLIEFGANVQHQTSAGLTAVEQTIWNGSQHGLDTLEEVKLLLEKGANPNTVASTGAPLLQLALFLGRLEHAKVLLEYGADPNQCSHDHEPETAFDVAKRTGNKAAMDLLAGHKKQTT